MSIVEIYPFYNLKVRFLTSSFNLFIFIFIMCVGIYLPSCMYVCVLVHLEVRVGFLRTGVLGGCEPLCKCWELNLGV